MTTTVAGLAALRLQTTDVEEQTRLAEAMLEAPANSLTDAVALSELHVELFANAEPTEFQERLIHKSARLLRELSAKCPTDILVGVFVLLAGATV